ncbi:TPA: HutD family protein [Burkholderia vietnamiensis]|nr:HutD family protein [Burkholderia vietnamiensis]HDR9215319.1 HutD family protein [Burkholderia vietnamiensis]
MMTIDVFPIESVAPEAWRNGGGTTRTLASEGARWRVSLASIERDGPYSRFPGIARASLVLGGHGVTLTGRESVVHLRPLIAEAYDGDVDWDAALVGGPSVALNVMTAKGRYRTSVRLVHEPVLVRPGCIAIAVALGLGFTFAEGTEPQGADVMPGQVLVSEHHATPLRLAPWGARGNGVGYEAYAALVTIEPTPVQEHP